MDRLGFEPRTSCLQSRRSSADLPARRAQSVAVHMKLSARFVRCRSGDIRFERPRPLQGTFLFILAYGARLGATQGLYAFATVRRRRKTGGGRPVAAESVGVR